MRWLWLGGAALFGVAAFSVWLAFRDPGFVSGLAAMAIGAAWKAFAPRVVQRMPAGEEAAWRASERAGRGDEWRRRKMKGGKPGRDR